MKRVILSGDDFGTNVDINAKILELLRSGVLTSTNLMVNRVTQEQEEQLTELRNDFARGRKQGVGVHLEFDINKPAEPQLQQQFERYLELFRLGPTHLDLHVPWAWKTMQQNHERPYVELVAEIDKFAYKHNLPFRNMGALPRMTARTTTDTRFFTSRLTFEEIEKYLEAMKDGHSYDLLFHPGVKDVNSNLNREQDYQNALRVHELLRRRPDVRLISYRDL